MPCIYCWTASEGRVPRAHIFAQSLFGDHDELVLTDGEVCGRCNNRFSRLEAAFKDRLGIMAMMLGPGRTRRGWATVNAPGISVIRDPSDPRVSINLGKRTWTTDDGRQVRPAQKKGERVDLIRHGQRPDGLHEFTVRQEMRADDVFLRVLAKIAFETICVHRGANYCADLRWCHVRGFILRGEGNRVYATRKHSQMALRPDGTPSFPVGISLVPVEVHAADGPWIEEWIALITIGATFAVDMSPHNLILPGFLNGPFKEAVRDQVVMNTYEGVRAA